MNENLIDRVIRSLATASSRRKVFSLAGGAAVGALATTGLQDAVAQRSRARRRNPFENINVSGKDRAGKKVFVGKLEITRFVADGGTLFAVGTLNGRLTRNNRTREVSGKRVRIPVQSINGVDLSSLASGATRVSAEQLVCNVLTLTLGPLDLNLLGLRVQLNRINLRITAIPGGGLLGDLLCAVANLLSGGPLGGLLGQISRLLNQILGALG
jgi:hypothetical protein